MYRRAENFPPPLCSHCGAAVLQGSPFLRNKVEKIGIKGLGGRRRGGRAGEGGEALASGFHLKHKGVFLPDLYSFTQ